MDRTTTSPEQPFKVTSAADIVSYVLHTLGFRPTESLVLLTLSGKRVGATLRVDLPAADLDPSDYAAGVCSILASDQSADGALFIIFTDDPGGSPGSPPRQELVKSLRRFLSVSGLDLRDGWLVSGTSWRDYFCADADCCPWPGHPVAGVRDSPLNAEFVYRGSSVADSLTAAVDSDAPAPWADPDEIARLVRVERSRLRQRWTRPPQFGATLALWNCLLEGPALPDEAVEVTAHLLASLTSRSLRDAVLVLSALGWQTASSGALGNGMHRVPRGSAVLPSGGRALLGLAPGQELPTGELSTDPVSTLSYCEVLIGRYRAQLQWDRIDAAHRLFSRLAAVAGGEPRAALLAMLGWIEWARGRGSRAHVYLSESLAERPGYPLAALLEEVVARGLLADWTRDKDLAWHHSPPGGPEERRRG